MGTCAVIAHRFSNLIPLLLSALIKLYVLNIYRLKMSDNEMLEDIDDVSPPLPHPSQGFNIADVLSTSSSTSIGQESMVIESQYMNINKKSDLSVDENVANENLKKLYPFVDQSVSIFVLIS